jgi:preprotein translocase subunit YajC
VENLFPFVLLALAVLLLFVLPARQRKQAQARAQELQQSLTVGTPVMTTSGMYGTVAGLGDATLDLEIAPGVVVTFVRAAVLEVRTPAATETNATETNGTVANGSTPHAPDAGSTGTTGGPADGTR